MRGKGARVFRGRFNRCFLARILLGCRRTGRFKILLRGLAGHLHKAAQRQQADLVIRLAVLEAEQPRAKAEGECLDAHLEKLGDDEMSQLVHDDHDTDEDNERYR